MIAYYTGTILGVTVSGGQGYLDRSAVRAHCESILVAGLRIGIDPAPSHMMQESIGAYPFDPGSLEAAFSFYLAMADDYHPGPEGPRGWRQAGGAAIVRADTGDALAEVPEGYSIRQADPAPEKPPAPPVIGDRKPSDT